MAPLFEIAGKSIFVAGHKGLVGQALVRRLSGEGAKIIAASRAELDLRGQAASKAFLKETAPDAVIVAAASVGQKISPPVFSFSAAMADHLSPAQ